MTGTLKDGGNKMEQTVTLTCCKKFLERVISLRRYPAPDDSSVETDAGIVSCVVYCFFFGIMLVSAIISL